MEWKQIDNTNYSVSSTGLVINNKTGRLLKPAIHNLGYLRIAMNKKSFLVHRLVAKAFILNPENLPIVNHKDGIKTNNNVENLEWCTHSENNMHSINTGLRQVNNNFLTKEEAIQIKYLNTPMSCKLLSELYGVHESTIWDCRNNRTWKYV